MDKHSSDNLLLLDAPERRPESRRFLIHRLILGFILFLTANTSQNIMRRVAYLYQLVSRNQMEVRRIKHAIISSVTQNAMLNFEDAIGGNPVVKSCV
jgi:hypothetical protein